MIFLVFLTQFSIFTIAEAVWTAECADKWLFFVQQNEADKKKMKNLFLGSWKLEIVTYFWLNSVKIHNFDTHFLKSCVLMWHTCPNMSVFGLQIHNTSGSAHPNDVKWCKMMWIAKKGGFTARRSRGEKLSGRLPAILPFWNKIGGRFLCFLPANHWALRTVRRPCLKYSET